MKRVKLPFHRRHVDDVLSRSGVRVINAFNAHSAQRRNRVDELHFEQLTVEISSSSRRRSSAAQIDLLEILIEHAGGKHGALRDDSSTTRHLRQRGA